MLVCPFALTPLAWRLSWLSTHAIAIILSTLINDLTPFHSLSLQAQSRGPVKFQPSREIAPSNSNYGLSSTGVDTATRTTSFSNPPAAKDSDKRSNRFRSRSFERPLPTVDTSKEIDKPVTKRRGRTLISPASTERSSEEQVTQSRKARVFQVRSKLRTDSSRESRQLAAEASEKPLEIQTVRRNPQKFQRSSSQEKGRSSSEGSGERVGRNERFDLSQKRQRAGLTTTTATTNSQPPSQRTNRLNIIHQKGRRFSHRPSQANDQSSTAPTSTEKERPVASGRSLSFRPSAKGKETSAEYVNSGIYEENYPDQYKTFVRSKIEVKRPEAQVSSRRIDNESFEKFNDGSIESRLRALTRNAFKKSTPSEGKIETTTVLNKYTTRPSLRISLPAYKRGISTTPKPSPSSGSNENINHPIYKTPKKHHPLYVPKTPLHFANKRNFSLNSKSKASNETSTESQMDKSNVGFFMKFQPFPINFKYVFFELKVKINQPEVVTSTRNFRFKHRGLHIPEPAFRLSSTTEKSLQLAATEPGVTTERVSGLPRAILCYITA